jgi:hypothetical protein
VQTSADAVISVLLELLSTADRPLSEDAVGALFRGTGWSGVCAVAQAEDLAARAYVKLRRYAETLPADVREWLEMRCAQTASRNRALAGVLFEIVAAFRESGIPVLSFKGPVLACSGSGLDVRSFRDLDILVHRADMRSAASVLERLGFFDPGGITPAPYHRIYMRPEVGSGVVVELHVDLYDRDRGVHPDIAGLWDRAVVTEVDGRPIPSPELTDHLLLTIMQLPHHGWRPALYADVADMIGRQQVAIEWDQLAERAARWGMRSLAGSVLDAVHRLLGVPLPASARILAHPQGAFQRTQWRLVREALYERLAGGRGHVCRAASWLVTDQSRAGALHGPMGDREAAGSVPDGALAALPHRLTTGARCLYPVLWALVRPEPVGVRHMQDGSRSRR